MITKELIIIGGGQSAIACGYFLRRTTIDYLVLDSAIKCGGAWINAWDSLTVFSSAENSSLPGWPMTPSQNKFPSREEVISYLCAYEKRYEIPVQRPVEVIEITKENDIFIVKTNNETYQSKAVISATGTFGNPFIPKVLGQEKFQGMQMHSSDYKNANELKGKKVLVVGEGNSGAQLLAEISIVANTKWSTRKEPKYLPDNVDGRVLFEVASAMYHAEQKGEKYDAINYNLSDIVMVPPVKEARERGVLKSSGSFIEMHENGVIWENGEKENFDVIVWCTGFGYATKHLNSLVNVDERGKIETNESQATEIPGLWLVGYGGWTGFASATLVGVGRSAKQTINEIENFLNEH